MAGGVKRKKTKIGKVDRISELPVNLKELILGYLSIEDAVATSVLSSEWRYCWTGLRNLVFDDDFWYGVEDDVDSKLLAHSRIIDRILMLHSGHVHKFHLFIPDVEPQPLDINLWLLVLSKKGVRHIEINASKSAYDPFPVPSFLFSCHELEELKLLDFKFTLPRDFKGFAKLKSLSLESSEIEPSALENLISQCLLLETLSIKFVNIYKPLAIEASNLKFFHFDGYDSDLINIIFKDVSKLTSVTLLDTNDGGTYGLIDSYSTLKRLRSISWIQELTFDFLLLEDLSENLPESLLTPLENLKQLTLTSVNLRCTYHIPFTFCLIRDSPNLQNLNICLYWKVEHFVNNEMSERVDVAATKMLKAEVKRGSRYNSIQTIEINGIEGLREEILLIKILKKTCPNAVIEKCQWCFSY